MICQDDSYETLLRKHAKFNVDGPRSDQDPMGWCDRREDKILFLDIDGVLIGQDQWNQACQGLTYNPFNVSQRKRVSRACDLDRSAVQEVKRILQRTGARLVIHSDWAIDLENADLLWQKMLAHGFVQDDFHEEWCLDLMAARLCVQHGIRLHPGVWGLNGDRDMRPWRIPAWLSWHQPAAIAILDDMPWESWKRSHSKMPTDRAPRIEPASLDTCQPKRNPYWVRVGNPTAGRDVLSPAEADEAIDLLGKPFKV